ncbi:acetoacetate decarboxylase family protein [Deinococcus deserti]|uniref:Acetoacetate decarboxylase n=1 Tax=Deinococcus deserti (strain DSM 17065 / CIP 109153 / LMG 22923 / VCD115) TaxID=546414 RepID=C1D1B7_DEIDV|nr:acetoacetate decarboxylase family protein [Deinococcus deserti]ACO45641.2 hypothetical protein Deide_07771 [Deinococcus deserti VCD115]
MTPPPWRLTGRAFLAVYAPGGGARAGALMLVRYSTSPVGSYDELMWLDLPTRLLGHPVIRHIVVSQEASMTWGRHNWAIPKKLASFDWSTPGEVQVTAAPGQVIAHLSFSESPWNIPMNLRWIPAPWRTLAQPALNGPGQVLTTPAGHGWIGLARQHRCQASDLVPRPARHRPVLALAVPEFTLLFPRGHWTP